MPFVVNQRQLKKIRTRFVARRWSDVRRSTTLLEELILLQEFPEIFHVRRRVEQNVIDEKRFRQRRFSRNPIEIRIDFRLELFLVGSIQPDAFLVLELMSMMFVLLLRMAHSDEIVSISISSKLVRPSAMRYTRTIAVDQR